MTSAYIPDQFYVGKPDDHPRRNKEDALLVFITPDGTDAAAKKRKATVQEWARGWGQKTGGKFWTFVNTPQTGFKLKQCKTRYSTSNKVWRVEDPRGFEIEIYSDNFMDILEHGTISKGEFVGKFIYGREGQKNTMIPLDSDMHMEALEYTASKAAPAGNAKNLVVGDKVQLRRFGELVDWTYCGRFYELKTHASPKPRPFDHTWRGYPIKDRKPEPEPEFLYHDSVSTTKGHYFFDDLGYIHGPISKVNFIKVIKAGNLKNAGLAMMQKFKEYYSGKSIWTKVDKSRITGQLDENRKHLVGVRNQRVEMGMSITNDKR